MASYPDFFMDRVEFKILLPRDFFTDRLHDVDLPISAYKIYSEKSVVQRLCYGACYLSFHFS